MVKIGDIVEWDHGAWGDQAAPIGVVVHIKGTPRRDNHVYIRWMYTPVWDHTFFYGHVEGRATAA